MKRNVIFYSRMILFMLGFTGVYLEITKHGGLGMLMYYTVLSNLLVLLFIAYLIFRMWTDNNWESSKLLRVKGGVTMCIMITCVVYHLLLAPIATDFYRLENPGIMVEDLFENLQDPHTVTVIEWADTVSEILPANHLRLEILINDDGSRTLNLTKNLTSEH